MSEEVGRLCLNVTSRLRELSKRQRVTIIASSLTGNIDKFIEAKIRENFHRVLSIRSTFNPYNFEQQNSGNYHTYCILNYQL